MSTISNNNKKNNNNNNDDDDDALYNSLCSLTNSKNKQKSKLVISPIQYKEGDKQLTFLLNEVNSTDGKSEITISNGKLGTKREILKKKIKSIGTTLKNCDQSDVISIDIDPESTRLPMMCKLMIIVEGAAYERGTRVLVRDAAIQVGEVCFNKNFDLIDKNNNNNNEKQIPIVKINESSSKSISDSVKYCSSENIVQHVNIKTNLKTTRNKSGGSLTNLTSIPLSVYSDDLDYNYFNKDLRNKIFESHLNLLEYTSVPFYQYISRNVARKDFYHPIQEDLYEYSFIEKKTTHSSSSSSNLNTHDFVEVKIPLRRLKPTEMYRNEKTILINGNHDYYGSNNTSLHRSIKNNMKRYLDEKLNRFEAEITFFNSTDSPVRHINPENYPLSYTYHFNKASNSTSNSSSLSSSNIIRLNPGKSCTNLVLVQIVDGRIME